MKKKFSVIILTIFTFCQTSEAKSLSNELVDLHKSHWAYKETTKLIDKFGLIQGFPDHTFRGEKGVNRYEFSVIILNMIKYLEDKRKISLKQNEIVETDNTKSLDDIPQNNWAQPAIMELKGNYNLILSPPYEKTFGGNKNISRFELAYTIDNLISLVSKHGFTDKSPYETSSTVKEPGETPEPSLSAVSESLNKEEKPLVKISPDEWAGQSIKNLMNYKIMIGFSRENDFRGLEEVNRYQLAIAIIKALEYIDNIR